MSPDRRDVEPNAGTRSGTRSCRFVLSSFVVLSSLVAGSLAAAPDATAQDTTAQDAAFKGAASQDAASKDAASQDAASLNPLKALGEATLDNFVQKPLFDPARRLPPPAPPMVVDIAPPPPPPPEPPPVLQLIGVIRDRHGDLAIARRDGGDKTVTLRTGDRLGQWTVTVRPPFKVTLSEGTRTVDFAIFAKAIMPPPGATPLRGTPPRDLAAEQGLRRPRDE